MLKHLARHGVSPQTHLRNPLFEITSLGHKKNRPNPLFSSTAATSAKGKELRNRLDADRKNAFKAHFDSEGPSRSPPRSPQSSLTQSLFSMLPDSLKMRYLRHAGP